MEEIETAVRTTRVPCHWAGLRAGPNGVEVALLAPEGETLEILQVPNDLRSIIRVVRHWVKAYGFDPVKAVFCVEDRSPWLGAVLERMLEQGWDVLILSRQRTQVDGTEEPVSAGLMEMVRLAMHRSIRSEPLSLALLRAEKVERLRERREEIAALRSKLQVDGGGRNRHLEEELKREFERMDRRHVQLIDKLLSRLDTLIGLQADG